MNVNFIDMHQEMANPCVRPYLHFFPEDSGLSISETWHTDHWLREADASLLTPMVRIKKQDYFIFEPTLLSNCSVCMPIRWLLHGGMFFANAWELMAVDSLGGWVVHLYRAFEISQNDLFLSFPLWRSSWQCYHLLDPAYILGVLIFDTVLMCKPLNCFSRLP